MMNKRRFKINTDPWDTGFPIFNKCDIGFNTGVTILVGCNGSGKTTMLDLISDALKSSDVSYIKYDNISDGGRNSITNYMLGEDICTGATLMTSSEGEQIYINIGKMAMKIGRFITENKDKDDIWILFDGIDSGLSIDNIKEIKALFNTILLDSRHNNSMQHVYIICTANTYAMCKDEDCFDVHNCTYRKFADYNDYEKFILESREEKDKRKY